MQDAMLSKSAYHTASTTKKETCFPKIVGIGASKGHQEDV
jgi:hypothetical protein